MAITVLNGDCIEIMRRMEADSVDSIVTDPPYGLGFMGKKWDELPPGEEWARECLRVLKPGGHLLAFGGTRTWHRLAVAVEDGGFEIRDSIAWLYGSGFPKSMDVSKAIDKAAGATPIDTGIASARHGGGIVGAGSSYEVNPAVPNITRPATDEAKQWEGWGTALKPAFEPIVVARKPLAAKTVVANVLEHGTGALNIDASRVAGAKPATTRGASVNQSSMVGALGGQGRIEDDGKGRFPANVVLDQHAAEALDEQSGSVGAHSVGKLNKDYSYAQRNQVPSDQPFTHGDKGGASRFFHTFKYQAKASKAERPNVAGVMHPTVKPVELMRWLVRLVTPPEGIVLDPFAGSGTTPEACVIEGFDCIAIEREGEYLPLIAARLDRHANAATGGAGCVA